jgi:hypothetical protein
MSADDKPLEVAKLHREICEREGCPFLDKINYADNCAACPEGHFARYSDVGCESANRIPPPSPQFVFTKPHHDGGTTIQIPLNEPGDMLAWAIHKLTGAIPCGACDARRKQMNEWGWAGCALHLGTIVRWITEEAKKRGHQVDRLVIFSLIRAAWSEARKQK